MNPTFIEAARRTQIIDCTIACIAELGYAQTSFTQIAKRAKISKGVISYYFATKDELMRAVVREVLSAFTAFVVSHIDAEPTVSAQLRAFIEANLAFMDTHRKPMIATFDIIRSARTEDGQTLISSDLAETDLTALAAHLQRGQEQGEFRAFNARIMAATILALRNELLVQLAYKPDLDLKAYAQEWVILFDLATRQSG
ncbi:MAG TPA: TetR/AcrR family transcriptional regulator [Phototrophicaceae bacterium]|nr:TetR/AcrR family transcriptional regulator [Phototrophicaceae bacterium]